MGWNTPDFYNQPSSFDVEILGTVQWTEQGYDFDMTLVVRKDIARTLYWADDSGNSSDSPFQHFDSFGDMETGTLADLQAHLEERLETASKDKWNDPWGDVAEILRRAAE